MANSGYLCRKCGVPFVDIATKNNHQDRCRVKEGEFAGQTASLRARRFTGILRKVLKEMEVKTAQA